MLKNRIVAAVENGKSIIIVLPYFGSWPEWINLFIESCKYNPLIDWLFYTDCGEPENKSTNVRYLHMSLIEYAQLASARLKLDIKIEDGYKTCDLRPFTGYIFEDYIKDYDYYGYGDVDLVYGDIMVVLDRIEFFNYDIISFHTNGISNEFCLFKNIESNRNIFRKIPSWEKIIVSPSWNKLDCIHFNDIFKVDNRDPKMLFIETFGTHYRNYRWNDGSSSWPSEWYWKEGKLTNNKSKGDFLFYHFMIWKGGRWGVLNQGKNSGQWKKLKKVVNLDYKDILNGFKINEKGFFKIK